MTSFYLTSVLNSTAFLPAGVTAALRCESTAQNLNSDELIQFQISAPASIFCPLLGSFSQLGKTTLHLIAVLLL